MKSRVIIHLKSGREEQYEGEGLLWEIDEYRNIKVRGVGGRTLGYFHESIWESVISEYDDEPEPEVKADKYGLVEVPTQRGAVIAEVDMRGVATGWSLTLHGDGTWRYQDGSRAEYTPEQLRVALNKSANSFGNVFRVAFDGKGARL